MFLSNGSNLRFIELYVLCYIFVTSFSGLDDEFVGKSGVVDQGLAADFFFMSVDFVHTGGDDDAGDTEGIDFVGVAAAEGCAKKWIESTGAAGDKSVLDDGASFRNCVGLIVAVVMDFDLGTPFIGSGIAAFDHVGDLGIEVGDGG